MSRMLAWMRLQGKDLRFRSTSLNSRGPGSRLSKMSRPRPWTSNEVNKGTLFLPGTSGMSLRLARSQEALAA